MQILPLLPSHARFQGYELVLWKWPSCKIQLSPLDGSRNNSISGSSCCSISIVYYSLLYIVMNNNEIVLKICCVVIEVFVLLLMCVFHCNI